MAIARDANSSSISGGATTLTWAHICGGSERILIVSSSVGDSGDHTTTGITYNGVALTKINSNHQSGVFDDVTLWYLVAPATGAHNIVITQASSGYIWGQASSYTGVDQTNPISPTGGVTAIDTATSQTVSITTTVDNSWIVGVSTNIDGASNLTAGSNTNIVLDNGTWSVIFDTNSAQTPAGSKSIVINRAASGKYAINIVAIVPIVTVTAPTVTTQAASSVLITSATGNGNVTADGGGTITERGTVISTSANPTTSDHKDTASGTTGAFTTSITALTAGTLYHVRAYAINSAGTSYGSDVSFTTSFVKSLTDTGAGSDAVSIKSKFTITDNGSGVDTPSIKNKLTISDNGGSGISADSGALSPGTIAVDETVGTIEWGNIDNAKVSDGLYARADYTDYNNNLPTHYLKATNFGFSIPVGAIINGILVEIEVRQSSTSFEPQVDNSIKIVKGDGTLGGTNKATGTMVTNQGDIYTSYGSSSDLWDESWDADKINDADFGVVCSYFAGNIYATFRVDHIRITVYYTVSGESVVVSNAGTIIQDNGVGTDTPSIKNKLTIIDSVSGVDNISSKVAISLLDSGGGVDTMSIKNKFTIADNGSGADTPSIKNKLTITDTGNGVDTPAVKSNLTITDSGSGVDTPSIRNRLTITDSGTGVDNATIKAIISLLDNGTGADIPSVKNKFTVIDSGVGSEQINIAINVLVSDLGIGVDSVNVLSTAKFVQDSGLGNDLIASINSYIAILDSGAGADSLIIKEFKNVLDSGIGTDNLTVKQFKAVLDNGVGTDAFIIKQIRNILDSGVASDNLVVKQFKTILDSGAGADALTVKQFKTVLDNGYGVEGVSLLTKVSLPDTGQGVDEIYAIEVKFTITDNGSGADTLTIKNKLNITDDGSGDDILAISKTLLITDDGSGADILSIKNKFTITDNGVGVDTPLIKNKLNITDDGAGADTILKKQIIIILDTGLGTDDIVNILRQVRILDTGQGIDLVMVPTYYKDKFSPRGTTYNNKYSARGTTYSDKFGIRGTIYRDKFTGFH